MSEVQFSLPAPHVYADGSIIDLTIHKWEEHDFITIRKDGESVLIGSPEHARQIARTLLIAADLWAKG